MQISHPAVGRETERQQAVLAGQSGRRQNSRRKNAGTRGTGAASGSVRNACSKIDCR